MITVETVYAQELPAEVKTDLEIGGDNYGTYLIIRRDGEIIFIDNDCMEPEDATFGRDLKWVKEMLLAVYDIGVTEGTKAAMRADA